ncbi:putative DNA condensation protein [Escherichia phage UE-S1]|nr:putative DNA condensation protein [Escherichia phage UE-S1]
MEILVMLPFVRMFDYGNIVPGPKNIIKVGASTQGQFLLTDSHDLYYIGRNQGGESGNGNKNTVSSWILVSADVSNFFVGDRALVIIKNDNTIWTSGETYWFTSSTTTSYSTVLVERTNWFTSAIPVSEIANIVCSYGLIFVLSTSSVLYGAGANGYRGALGIGSSSIYTLTQCATNVRKVMTNANDSMYITLDNKLYSSGWNDRGQHGTGNRTQINTWGLRSSGVIDAVIGGNAFNYYNGTSYFVCGQTPNFLSSDTTSFRAVPASTLPNSSPLFMTNSPALNTATQMIITSTYQKGVGANRGLGLNNSQTGAIYSATNLQLPVEVSEIRDVLFSDGLTSILTKDGDVYSTGSYYAIPGASEDVAVFTKIDLPK